MDVPPVDTPATRICTVCHEEKSLETDFRTQINGKYGRQSACKACAQKVLIAYRQTPKGKAKYLEYARRHRQKAGYAEKHRAYRLRPKPIWRSYLSGAEKRGLPFDFTLEEFTARFWQKPCWYCGEVLSTAGADRIDSTKGYTQDNTVPCCSVCNFMKLRTGQDEFIAKCRQIAEHCSRSHDK